MLCHRWQFLAREDAATTPGGAASGEAASARAASWVRSNLCLSCAGSGVASLELELVLQLPGLFVAQLPAQRHLKIIRGFCKCARLQLPFGTRAYHVCTAVQREEIVMRYSLERAWGCS